MGLTGHLAWVPYVVFVPWFPHLQSGGDKHIHLIWLLALIDLKYY